MTDISQRLAQVSGGGHRMSEVVDILNKLEKDPHNRSLWYDFGEPVYHQGLVSELSYAAVIQLAELAQHLDSRPGSLYGWAEAIEVSRMDKTMPTLPEWMEPAYRSAIHTLAELAAKDIAQGTDQHTSIGILSFLAAANNLHFIAERIIGGEGFEVTEEMWDANHDPARLLDFS